MTNLSYKRNVTMLFLITLEYTIMIVWVYHYKIYLYEMTTIKTPL